MSIIPKSLLPLEAMYEFKMTFAKYWRKILKPAFIQSLFGDMIMLMLLLSIWHHYLNATIIVTGVFFMWVGLLIVHIVFRCLRGESVKEDYERDE
jgi:hypothetical protein